MTKKGKGPSQPGSKDGIENCITISAAKTEEGFQIVEMFGHSIRAEINNGEPWFVVSDLSKMFGVHEKTIPTRIKNNPEDFEGWTKVRNVTYPRGDSPQSENLLQSDLLVNEQAVYLIMGGLTTKRIKTPEARNMVRKFKRAFPELLKMIRTGEVKIVKTEGWDYKRYLAAQGAKFLGDSIHAFIDLLARDPKHEKFVHMNNHKMINIIVFGRHEKGIRDTATKEQLEAIHMLEIIDGTLIKSGMIEHKERKDRLAIEYLSLKQATLSVSHQAVFA